MTKLFILIAVMITGLFGYPQWQAAQAEQQILKATVQITMIVPQLAETESSDLEPLPIPPDEYRPIARPETYVVSEGLGTVVLVNGRTFLITHDHWSQLTADLGEVQFRDAAGVLLMDMDLYQFRQLILARNGGTMVLSLPDAWQHLAVSQNVNAFTNDELLLAHRQGGQVVVSPVRLVETGVKDGVAVWRLQGEAVVSGDSGGGVWGNGRLLGVLWATVMLEDEPSQERQQTDMSVAAVWEMS